jgi:hypothetical protein
MPTYEYRCGECGTREEHTHQISKAYSPPCPKCGHTMRMLFSPPLVVFNGGGWAKKDRRTK